MPAPSLVQAYTNLSPAERHVTHLCALAGEALKPNTLAKLSKAAGWSNGNGKKLLQADARTMANKLVRNNVLRQAAYSGVVINPDVQDLAVQDCIREGWFDKLARFLQEKFPRSSYGYNQPARTSRDLRIAFYEGDVDTFKSLAVHSSKTDGSPQMLDPFSQDIYDRLDPILQEMYLIDVIPRMIVGDDGCPAAFQAFEKLADSQTKPSDDFAACAIDVYVAGGRLEALRNLDQRTGGKIVEIAGCEAFLRGDYDHAETCFAAAMPIGKRTAKKSKTAMRHLPAVLYVLLLLKQHSAEAGVRAFQLLNAVAKARGGKYTGMTKVLGEAAMFQQTPCPPAEFIAALKQACNSDLALLLAGYVWTWSLTEEDAELDVSGLAQAAKSYEQLGLSWLAAEAAGLAGKTPLKSAAKLADKCGHLHDQLKTKSLVDAVRPAPIWERALTAISQLGAGQQPSVSTSRQTAERMIWEISYSTRYPNVNLHPILQKRTAGGWTKGRKVSLERLYNQHNEAEFAFLTDQDIAICRSLQAETDRNHYGYTETTYSFDSLRAARAIVGHPCIFRESDRENPIEIVEQEPHLVVTKTKDKRIAVSLNPSPSKTRDDDFRIAKEGTHRLAFVFFNEQHRELHEILGDQLIVPESAAERVMKTVQSVASLVAVHSEIGAGDSAVEAVAGEPRPHLHLLPYHAGLQLSFTSDRSATTARTFRPAKVRKRWSPRSASKRERPAATCSMSERGTPKWSQPVPRSPLRPTAV